MEKVMPPPPQKRGLVAILKRAWNALLPDYIDSRISAYLGPLFLTLIEIETDCEEPMYGKNPKREYMPKIGGIRFERDPKGHLTIFVQYIIASP